jgi:DNA primase
MNDAVSEVKKRIDIVDFIGSFIELHKSGRNYKALCPFHQEKTPSFIVSPERQIWHCFGGCSEGGDVIRFLMKWENITFYEALKDLADKVNVKLTSISFEDKLWKKKNRLLSLNVLASEYFNYILFKSKFAKKARLYLNSRSVNQKIANKFNLGYAPKSWDSLYKFLIKKNYTYEEIFDAGLIIKGKEKSYYDRFRGRIIFPIKDSRENIIGFSGRSIDENQKEAKYINTPETIIYHKRESLYGINLSKDTIRKENNVYIVEGEFDVISMYKCDFKNVVAIKGSAFTREQLMFLKRFTNKITLALDADSSGEEAIKRTLDDAESLDFEVRIIFFDYAKDPDEAIKIDLNKFKQVLKKSVSIYDFVINYAQKKYPESDAFSKKRIGDIIIPFIEKIKNPIVQSHYVKKLALLLNVSENSIFLTLKRFKDRIKQKGIIKSSFKKEETETRDKKIQKYVLSLIFQSKDPYKISEKLFNIINPKDFSILSYEKISELFLQFKEGNRGSFDINKFLQYLKPELKAVFDELYLYATYEADFEEINLSRLFYEIKKFAIKREITKVISEKKQTLKTDKILKSLSSALKKVEKNALTL